MRKNTTCSRRRGGEDQREGEHPASIAADSHAGRAYPGPVTSTVPDALPPCSRRGVASRSPTRTPRARTPSPRATASAGRAGERHAVEDFLYDYYGTKPSLLRRWHPGAGVALGRRRRPREHAAGAGTATDADGAVTARRRRRSSPTAATPSRFVRELLGATASRRPARSAASGCTSGRWSTGRTTSTGTRCRCGSGSDGHRRRRRGAPDPLHALRRVPLLHARGGRAQPAAADPRRAAGMEQPGCLHAGDGPLQVGAQARARSCPATCCSTASSSPATSATLDMQASPYDVTDVGLRARRHRDARGQGRVRAPAAGLRGAGERAAGAAARGVRQGARGRTVRQLARRPRLRVLATP